jgi:hypothetical protein
VIAIAMQVSFIFAFLTVFFFLYVQKVEKEEFKKQIDIIVDNLSNDISAQIPNLIKNKGVDIDSNDSAIIINGIIDVIQEKMSKTPTKSSVVEQNHHVKLTALRSLSAVFALVIGVSLLIILLGFCIPVSDQVKESMLIVIFVGITELTFLQLIAKNYISASPNRIKRELASAIQNWIKNNKK